MDNYNPQTPTSGKGSCSRAENDGPSPITEARGFSLHLNNARDSSWWKPLTECPNINISPEPSIFVPDPSPAKTLQESDGDTPKSETLGGSLSRRRRHGEYHHRPPVWNIRPLDEDVSAFSSVDVEVDSDILDSLTGLKTDNASSRSHTPPTVRSHNLIPQSNVHPSSIMYDYPHCNLPGNTLLEAQLDAMASTWSREPFIVAMAGTDVEDSNGSDDGQRITGTHSLNSVPEELAPAYSRPSPRRRITSWPTHSSTHSIESDESRYTGASASPAPESGVSYVSDSAGPSRTSGDIYEPFLHVNEPDGREGGEERGHFQLVKVPSLSPVIEQPQDENSPPRELEGDLGPSEREEFFSVPTTTVEQPGDSNSPSCQQEEEHGSSENIESSSTPVRMQQSQRANSLGAAPETGVTGLGQVLPPYQQQRIESKYMSSYRDIRFLPPTRTIGFPLPPKRMFGWAIETGSRVICVCDTVVDSAYNDVFPMRLGDAYTVLKMYGDFWASCLRLTLENQTWSAYPLYQRNRDRTKATFICPDQNVGFLPLCALTLDANFGDYLARHPKSGGPCYSPATGQQVVPPTRSFSSPLGLRGHSVVVPKKILRQAKYPNMPRNMSAIASPDYIAMDFGHVCESKPSQLINVDPDHTHIRPIDNIWRFKARVEKKLSRQSLRDASEKLQESSVAFGKLIGGQVRRKFHSDPGSSGIRRRFFASHGTPSTETPAGQGESDSHQATIDAADTSDRNEAAGGNPQQATENAADSSRETQATEEIVIALNALLSAPPPTLNTETKLRQ
ncbi:hypothetical protein GX50_04130 [[Emmonsia] crescens]|uniref:Uncharacterized protein n=1 Tax=[Emmonsia] crescens TaxID=73230 RepID=A0A2B7ZGE3_9EURO|nr:hypothetical protein GX50_04130 [Emmonsia crescens]